MGKTVFLSLKKEWYEMIESGVKLHEYRSITPYWCQRFLLDGNGNKRPKDYWAGFLSKYCFTPHEYRLSLLIGWLKKGYVSFQNVTKVVFSYGYTRRRMTFKVTEICFGTGYPSWGADPGEPYFVIKLSKNEK